MKNMIKSVLLVSAVICASMSVEGMRRSNDMEDDLLRNITIRVDGVSSNGNIETPVPSFNNIAAGMNAIYSDLQDKVRGGQILLLTDKENGRIPVSIHQLTKGVKLGSFRSVASEPSYQRWPGSFVDPGTNIYYNVFFSQVVIKNGLSSNQHFHAFCEVAEDTDFNKGCCGCCTIF